MSFNYVADQQRVDSEFGFSIRGRYSFRHCTMLWPSRESQRLVLSLRERLLRWFYHPASSRRLLLSLRHPGTIPKQCDQFARHMGSGEPAGSVQDDWDNDFPNSLLAQLSSGKPGCQLRLDKPHPMRCAQTPLEPAPRPLLLRWEWRAEVAVTSSIRLSTYLATKQPQEAVSRSPRPGS